uniref:p23 n=1 Tax=Olive leaf yellowing-associated virus TaxID=82791 RepID=A0A7L9K4B4_9CLOS|nr:p23 [Olive leaf yellowing-associated virus]
MLFDSDCYQYKHIGISNHLYSRTPKMVSNEVKALYIKRTIIRFYEGIITTDLPTLVKELQFLRCLYFSIRENSNNQISTNFRTLFQNSLRSPWCDLPEDLFNKMYDDNLLFLNSDIQRILEYFIKDLAWSIYLKRLEDVYDIYFTYTLNSADYNLTVDNITIALSQKIREVTGEHVGSIDLLLPLELKKIIFEKKPLSYKRFFDYIKEVKILQVPELYIFNGIV